MSLWKDGVNVFDADRRRPHGHGPLASGVPLPRRPEGARQGLHRAHRADRQLVQAPRRRLVERLGLGAGLRQLRLATTARRCCASPAPGASRTAPSTAPAIPYLAATAVLAAGLDGIERELDPGAPTSEHNLHELDDAALAELGIERLPENLLDATRELERDDVLREALGSCAARGLRRLLRADQARGVDRRRTNRSPNGSWSATCSSSEGRGGCRSERRRARAAPPRERRAARRSSDSSAPRPTSATCSTASSTCSRRSSGCHACFVYLRGGRPAAAAGRVARLRPRTSGGSSSASTRAWPAGRCATGARHSSATRAMDDPRTNYVPELEEERFQSMAAVPVPARDGEIDRRRSSSTPSPRTSSTRASSTCSRHTASLIAGTIENAQLSTRTRGSASRRSRGSRALSQRIAAVTRRAQLVRRRDQRHPRAAAVRRTAGCSSSTRTAGSSVVAGDPLDRLRRAPRGRPTSCSRCSRAPRPRRSGCAPSSGACWACAEPPEAALAVAGRGRRRAARGACGRGRPRAMVAARRRSCCARSPTRSRSRSRRPR